MSVVLCEQCYPYGGNLEIYATVPMGPCEICGVMDNRHEGGAVAHLYPRDPRNLIMIRARTNDGTFILGLDAENIKRLTHGHPILVNLTENGGSDKIVIMYGTTLEDVAVELESVFGKLPPAQSIPKDNA